MDQYIQIVAGGTLTAAEALLAGHPIAIHWDGGR